MLKLEHHGQLAAVWIAVQFGQLRVGPPGLPHGDQVGLLKGLSAQLPQKFMEPGAVVGDFPVRLLGNLVNHIQPESSHTFPDPPIYHIVDFLSQFRILPVQVRLLYGKLVEIILLHFGNPLPGRTAKTCPHVVGRRTLCAVPPDIIVVIGILPALLRLQKPEMLVGGMVQHQIHDDADTALPRLFNQFLHVLQRAKHGVDVLIVRDVVTIVVLWGSAHRGEPDCVYPQSLQIVQLRDDPLQVSYAVPVAVREAAGIDLINHGAFPPFAVV